MSEPDDIGLYEEAEETNIYQNTPKEKEEGELTEDEMTRQETEQYEKELEAKRKEEQGNVPLKDLVSTFDNRVKKLAGQAAKESLKDERRRRRSASRSGDRGRPPDQQRTYLNPLREKKDKLGKAQKPIQVLRLDIAKSVNVHSRPTLPGALPTNFTLSRS